MTPPRRVLLVVGGGIAAYKALLLIRELTRRGIATRCVMTRAAAEFVTPLSLASLSGDKVYDDLFSLTEEAEMGHIELSRSADLVVAPATANLLGKAAQGLADDLASTLLLATDKRVLAAPAMNVRMWLHPSVARNVARLEADGWSFIGPDEGEMACGEFGPGRMAEPPAIADRVLAMLAGDTAIPLHGASAPSGGSLAGRRVLVTSGPTHEAIDPVRYLANRSSGRQGHAIAAAAAAAGGEVTLVSGPVAIPDPAGVRVVRVESAREMLAAVEATLPADVGVFCAAIADWRVDAPTRSKLKKGAGGPPSLTLVPNPDILATVAKGPRRPAMVVGFAAETDDVIAHARAKLFAKGCDLVVANDVGPSSGVEGGVMGGTRNAVHLVSRGGVESWPAMAKDEVARALVARIARELAAWNPASSDPAPIA